MRASRPTPVAFWSLGEPRPARSAAIAEAAWAGGNFDATLVNAPLPRTVELQCDTGSFVGTEANTPYPRFVALSPSGSLVLEAPVAAEPTAGITASDLPPNCASSCLSSVTGGAFSDLVDLGCFETPPDGTAAFGTSFPPRAETASDYFWEALENCSGMALVGPNPGGSYPRVVSLQPFDLAVVPTTLTIEPPLTIQFEDVSGSGLPPDTLFVIYRAGVATGTGGTDSDGTFLGDSVLDKVPSVFPRSLSLESFDGTLLFTASETQGVYPQSVPMSPAGSLVFEAPLSQTTAVIRGDGLPAACDGFALRALSPGTDVSMGSGPTDSKGRWGGFNLSLTAEREVATEYLWKGQGSCAGRNFKGTNPMGPFPRTMTMTPAPNEVREVTVDIRPGSCRNPVDVDSRGVLPVAVAGAEDFDVAHIDPASVQLDSFRAPKHISFQDVTSTRRDAHGCPQPGPDGFPDLVLQFPIQGSGLEDTPDGSRVHPDSERFAHAGLRRRGRCVLRAGRGVDR